MKVTFRTHSISPGDHRSSRGSGPAVPDEVLATTGLGGSARQMSARFGNSGSRVLVSRCWLSSGRSCSSRGGRGMRNRSPRPDVLPRKPWLLAIGRVLAAEYTAVPEPVPAPLAALLTELD